MKQKLLFILTLLLCVCSGAWADDCTTLVSFATSQHQTSSPRKVYGYTSTEMTEASRIELTCDNSDTKGQNNGVEIRLNYGKYLQIPSQTSVKSVTIDYKFYNSGNTERTCSLKVAVGSTEKQVQIKGKNDDGYKTAEFTFSPAATGDITITNMGSGSSNFNLYLDNITYCTASSTPKTATTTAINSTGITNLDIKDGTAAGTLTATVTPEGGDVLASPTITWSSDDTSIATVDETTGVVTLVSEGTATITASYAGDDDYSGSDDTYEIVVTDTRTAISPSLSYDNSTLILGATTTANPTLTGNTGSGTVTYSSDATGVATVDAETGIATAVAAGTAHITATIAATSEYKGGSAEATITVAVNPLGTGKTVTWTLSPINSSDKTLTSTSVSSSIYLKNIHEIDHSNVTLNDSPSKASNRTAKIDRTVDKANDKYVYVAFDVQDGYYFIPTEISLKVANVSNVTTFDAVLADENDVIIGESSKTFASTDGTVESWVIANSDKSKMMSGTVTLKIYGYAETAGSYRFGNQFVITGDVVEVVPVSVSSIGWSTFSDENKNLDFTGISDVTAYMVTAVDETTLTLTGVDGTVPANTGLLISGEASASASIPVAASSSTDVSSNLLVAGDGGTVNSADKYVMVARGGKAVFAHTGDNAATVAKGKAYLDLSGTSAKNIEFFVIDDSTIGDDYTTGITTVSQKNKNVDGIYTLSGQKVIRPTKGIYVINGKKVVVK